MKVNVPEMDRNASAEVGIQQVDQTHHEQGHRDQLVTIRAKLVYKFD